MLRSFEVVEIHSPAEVKKRELFNKLVRKTWGSSANPHNDVEIKDYEQDYEQIQYDSEIPSKILYVEETTYSK